MVNKHRFWFGFFFSLLFHVTVIVGIVYTVKADSSNGYQAKMINSNISVEMIMGMTIEESEPIAESVLQPVNQERKEVIADSTVNPDISKLEKPKEILPNNIKERQKEKAKKKIKKEVKKEQTKGEHIIASSDQINSSSVSINRVNTSNPNLIGKGNSSDEVNAYRNALRHEIERHKRYPQRAKMMRKQGVAVVSFNIANDGILSNVQLITSSGNNDLDNAALEAVKKTHSIGPKPFGMASLITVPIRFNIK